MCMRGQILGGLKVILMLLVAISCNSVNVHSDYVVGTRFEQYNRFCWVPTMDSSSGTMYDNPIFFQNLKNSITKEMTEKGYAMDCKNPDMLILVHAQFRDEKELQQIPVYSNYGYNIPDFYAGPGYAYNYYSNVPNITGYRIQSVEYTKGTLVVDIVGQKNNQLLWRGWATTDINNPKGFQKNMDKAVRKLLEDYPKNEF